MSKYDVHYIGGMALALLGGGIVHYTLAIIGIAWVVASALCEEMNGRKKGIR